MRGLSGRPQRPPRPGPGRGYGRVFPELPGGPKALAPVPAGGGGRYVLLVSSGFSGRGVVLRVLWVGLGDWAGKRVGERVLEAWGGVTRLAGNRGLGSGTWESGGGTAFLCRHNEILMTDPFS